MEFDQWNISQTVYHILEMNRGHLKEQDSPVAYLTGGQPGAGKSNLIRSINQEQRENAFFINGDEYRRYHPRFHELKQEYGNDWVKHTQKFAGCIVEALIRELSDYRYNLVIEGTFRTAEVPKRTAQLLKAKGYRVEALFVATNKQISWKSTINRYEEMKYYGLDARITPVESHAEAVRNIGKNVNLLYSEGIFDRITIHARDYKILYDSDKNKENPGNVLDKVIGGDSISRREKKQLEKMEASIERFRIMETIRCSGYRPDERMIANMRKVNAAFKGFHTVDAVKRLYGERAGLPLEKRELVEKVYGDLAKQERNLFREKGMER